MNDFEMIVKLTSGISSLVRREAELVDPRKSPRQAMLDIADAIDRTNQWFPNGRPTAPAETHD